MVQNVINIDANIVIVIIIKMLNQMLYEGKCPFCNYTGQYNGDPFYVTYECKLCLHKFFQIFINVDKDVYDEKSIYTIKGIRRESGFMINIAPQQKEPISFKNDALDKPKVQMYNIYHIYCKECDIWCSFKRARGDERLLCHCKQNLFNLFGKKPKNALWQPSVRHLLDLKLLKEIPSKSILFNEFNESNESNMGSDILDRDFDDLEDLHLT
jgi:hypothetical protein